MLQNSMKYPYLQIFRTSERLSHEKLEKQKSGQICKGLRGFWCVCYILDQSKHSQGGLDTFLVACFIIRSLAISLTNRMPLLQQPSLLIGQWINASLMNESRASLCLRTEEDSSQVKQESECDHEEQKEGEIWQVQAPTTQCRHTYNTHAEGSWSTPVKQSAEMPDLCFFIIQKKIFFNQGSTLYSRNIHLRS